MNYQPKYTFTFSNALVASFAVTNVFAAAVPPQIQTRSDLTKRAGTLEGSVTAHWDPKRDFHFITGGFGTPVQPGFKLLLDAGSADMWAFTDTWYTDELLEAGHHVFYIEDPQKKSTTVTKTAYRFKVEYFDGTEYSGPVVRDNVLLGGDGQHPVGLNQMFIGAPTKCEPARRVLEEFHDGLIGVGFSQTGDERKSFFQMIADELKRPVLTMTLPYKATGKFDFGFIDSTRYPEAGMLWVPLSTGEKPNRQARWDVQGKDSTGQLHQFISIDNGSEDVLLPTALWKVVSDAIISQTNKLVEKVHDDTTLAMPCGRRQALSKVERNLLSFQFLLQDGSFSKPVDIDPLNLYSDKEMEDREEMCYLKISKVAKPYHPVTLGVPFFNTNFVALELSPDKLTGRVGLAPLKL